MIILAGPWQRLGVLEGARLLRVYVPYYLYSSSKGIVGADSHFWPVVDDARLRALLVRPGHRLKPAPGAGIVLDARVSPVVQERELNNLLSLKPEPVQPKFEDLMGAYYGLEPRELGGVGSVSLLARLVAGGHVEYMGGVAWFALDVEAGCRVKDSAYSLLFKLSQGARRLMGEICGRWGMKAYGEG